MIQASREVGVEKEAIESACEKGKRPSHRDFLKAKLGKDEVKMALGSRVFFVTQPRGWGWGWGAVSQGVCVTWVGCASGRMGFWALEMRVRRRPSSPDALRLQGSWGLFLLSFLPLKGPSPSSDTYCVTLSKGLNPWTLVSRPV